jgi:beta-N-acetylhexosaminidase
VYRSSRGNRCIVLAVLALVVALALPPAGAAGPTARESVPSRAADDAAVRAAVLSPIAGMSLEEKVGQPFVTYACGQSADEVDPRNRLAYGVDTPAQVVQKYELGGKRGTRT